METLVLGNQLVLDGFGWMRSPEETFHLRGDRVVRTVRHRCGLVTSSEVPLLCDHESDPTDAFDASWLRLREEPHLAASRTTMTIADLFSGCGGLSLGVREALRALSIESRVAFASEIDDVALDVYRRNFRPTTSASLALEEIVDGELGSLLTQSERKLRREVGPIHFVLAGPPCQGHSDLNNHSRRADPKNLLVLRVVRFVEVFKPLHVLIENVQGIRHDRLGALALAKDALQRLGYSFVEGLVRADEIGVAQTRRRYFLFASRGVTHSFDRMRTPYAVDPRPLSWAIGDLTNMVSEAEFDSPAKHSVENQRRIEYLFANDLYNLPDAQRPDCHAHGAHSYKAVYGRMRWDLPAPTITTGFGSTGQGRFVHPLIPRTLTPHESARVQFFPDFFDFGRLGRRQYQRLIGNAVPSKLAYAVTLHQLG